MDTVTESGMAIAMAVRGWLTEFTTESGLTVKKIWISTTVYMYVHTITKEPEQLISKHAASYFDIHKINNELRQDFCVL